MFIPSTLSSIRHATFKEQRLTAISWIVCWLGALAVLSTILVMALQAPANRSADPLTFCKVLGAFFIVAYVADPLYIAATGRYGLDAKHWWWIGETGAANIALLFGTATIFIAAITIGYRRGPHRLSPTVVLRFSERRIDNRRLSLALVAFGAVSVGAILSAYASALQSADSIIAVVGYKQSVFAGKGYLLLLALLYKAAVLVWSTYLFREDAPIAWRVWVPVYTIGVIIDLATGTRSNLLFANVLVVAHLWHKFRRPLSFRAIATGAIALAMAALLIRVFTRDVAFSENRGQTPFALLREAIGDLADAVLFDEVQSTDTHLIATAANATGTELLYGKTIVAALMAPAPRSIFPWKPYGGNAEFTNKHFPTRYQSTRVEYAVSMMTELYMNGLLLAVALGGLAIGWLGSLIDAMSTRATPPLLACLQSILLFRSVSLVRGDLFQWVNNIFMTVVAVSIAYLFITRTTANSVGPATRSPSAPRSTTG